MMPVVVQIPFDRPTDLQLSRKGRRKLAFHRRPRGLFSPPVPLSFEPVHGRELFEESLSFKMRLVTVTGKNVQPGALSPPGLAATASKLEEESVSLFCVCYSNHFKTPFSRTFVGSSFLRRTPRRLRLRRFQRPKAKAV